MNLRTDSYHIVTLLSSKTVHSISGARRLKSLEARVMDEVENLTAIIVKKMLNSPYFLKEEDLTKINEISKTSNTFQDYCLSETIDKTELLNRISSVHTMMTQIRGLNS